MTNMDNMTIHTSSAPEPLVEVVDIETPKFPIESIGILSDAASSLSEHIQVPEGLAGMSVLTAAALVAQAHVDVLIDGRRFPCSLFGITVAESGDRKSQTDTFAMRAHRDWEEQAAYQRGRNAEEERAAQTMWAKMLTTLEASAKDPASLRQAIQELGPKPQLSLDPTLTVSSPTFEGLIKAYVNGLPYKGLFTDEGASFFGGYSMRSEGVKATIAGLSKLWDGAPIKKNNAADGATFALWGRRLSAHIMMQPVIAKEVLNDPLLNEQGFLPRFLLTWPKSLRGTRKYRGTDPTKDCRLIEYWDRMTQLLNRPVQTTMEGKLELRALELSPEAHDVFVEAYNDIEEQLAPYGSLSDIGAYGSKAAELAARVAAVLAFVEEPECAAIEAHHMRGGVAVVRHSLDTVQAARTVSEASKRLGEVQRLKAWLVARTRNFAAPHAITKTEILWNFPGKIKAERLDSLTSVLVEKGWLKVVPGGAEYKGQMVKQAWEVCSAA